MNRNLSVLCDYGLDDAVASIYILENADKFDKIDFLAVAGNFPLDISFRNLKRLLSNYPDLPENVRIVDTSSIIQNEENIPHIHGNDGMGDVLPLEYNYVGEVIKYDEWLNISRNTQTQNLLLFVSSESGNKIPLTSS
jgi:inosine-uridine nucleoside N-ribohydrolase